MSMNVASLPVALVRIEFHWSTISWVASRTTAAGVNGEGSSAKYGPYSPESMKAFRSSRFSHWQRFA